MVNEDYFVRFEVSYGVHRVSFGDPLEESKIVKLDLKPSENPLPKIRSYLVDSGLFPSPKGYLGADILEVYNGEKVVSDFDPIKVFSMDLISKRGLKNKNLEAEFE